MTKTCTECQQDKPLDDFSPHPKGLHGRQSKCKFCQAQRMRRVRKERQQADPATYALERRAGRLSRFGLTLEAFAALAEAQGGVCAICEQPPTGGRWDTLYVDHDHACCDVGNDRKTCGCCNRGLLCSRCNTLLGLVRDDPQLLMNAVRYLTVDAAVC